MLEMPMNRENKKWVKQQILRVPPELRQFAKLKYEEVFWESYNAEPIEHKKSNTAVRAANTRLRIFVEKVT